MPTAPTPKDIVGVQGQDVATLDYPWALTFLPDGRFLVSERDNSQQVSGKLWLFDQTGTKAEISGLPANFGVLDIALDPKFGVVRGLQASNRKVYITFLEPGDASTARLGRGAADTSLQPMGLALLRADLVENASGPTLENVTVIWRQTPKIGSLSGSGEPGGMLAFSPDGKYLFLTSGDRQELDPDELFDLSNTLGKTIRILPNGSIPADNPFVNTSGASRDIWTLGHRNPYGLAFSPEGLLWQHEQGPQGGDEFNLLEAGGNYGWPKVSNGRNYGATYDGLPDHRPGDGYVGPAAFWDPAIAPSGLLFYKGSLFDGWQGSAVLGALRGRALHRLSVSGRTASKAQSIAMDARIRDVAEAADGAIWVVEDKPSGKIRRLTPVFAQ